MVQDDTRLQSLYRYILERTNKLCIASHLGRPSEAKEAKYSMAPVGELLADAIGREVLLMSDYALEPVDQILRTLSDKQVILLENLRFHQLRKITRQAL